MADYVDGLTDAELRTKLAEFGFPVVPITATTRKVMSKKLKLLIDNKNKVNSEGRRSLAKYSSEEESDGETKIKRDKNRRATVAAAVMQPPALAKSRKSTRIIPKEESVDIVPTTTSTVNTEIKTSSRRTTRIIKPVVEADFETGSDSEPEIEDFVNNGSGETEVKSSTSYGMPSSSFSSGVTVTRIPVNLNKPTSTEYTKPTITEYTSPKPVTSSTSYTSRYTSYGQNSHDSGDSLDKLNQIRSRLSLGTNYDRPTFATTSDRKVIGSPGYGDGDATVETPFLSNFTRRLSQLSSSPVTKQDYNYKNDIIKEHDANGSSYNRLYFSRSKKRDYPQDFKTSQEKNIFKNNVVSLALLGIACAFFVVIFVMYMGIRTEHLPAIMDTSDILKRLFPFLSDNKE